MRTTRTSLVLLAWAATGPAWAGWDEGVAAFKTGNFNQAATEFQAVVDSRPDWAGGYLMLGQAQLKLNRGDAAVASLRKAYDLNPTDVAAQMSLSRAYLEVRRYADAAELLKRIQASSLSKEQAGQYHQMVAVAASRTGADPVGPLRQAAAANPNDADAQHGYGIAALNAGDTAAAIAALEKAVRLDGKDPDKQRGLAKALLTLGRETRDAAQKKAAYTKAVTAAQGLTSKDGSYESLLLLGEAQLGATQYDGAATTFSQAAAKGPGEWLPLFYQGQAFTASGDYERAEPVLKQALNKPGTDTARIWRQLGFVYEKKKNYTASIEAYNKAGDSGGAARALENQKIADENKKIEEQNAAIRQLEEESRKLEAEARSLQGGKPPAP